MAMDGLRCHGNMAGGEVMAAECVVKTRQLEGAMPRHWHSRIEELHGLLLALFSHVLIAASRDCGNSRHWVSMVLLGSSPGGCSKTGGGGQEATVCAVTALRGCAADGGVELGVCAKCVEAMRTAS